MYNQRPPFLPGGGGAPQQQFHLNPNIFPNPNNHFLLQQDPNFLPHPNPFFQYPSNFPQFQYQLPCNSFPIQSNSSSSNNNRKFLPQVKVQNETIDKLDKAVLKAHHDFLSLNENVTAWKVSQAALLTVKAESWGSLGCQMQQVPSLNRLLVTEGKINAFIHCFVAVRRILSLYDLEVAICESEGIERFEELELGPLIRHPLIVHYFGVNSDVTEVYKISSEEIICYLSELLETRPKKEVEVDTLLDFISKKKSGSRSQKLCVRIQNIGMYLYQIKKAKQSEHAVLKSGSEQTRKRALQRRNKRPLFSAQKEHLDEHFSAISQRIKSFSSENTEFCGKHVRFESSSSEDDDRVDDEYKDNQVENSAGNNCSLPLSNVKSDHVSRCPYPSANEERTRLGLKSEADCNLYTADGGVRCDTEHEQSKRKRRSENESFITSPRKYPKMDKSPKDRKHKDLNGRSLTNEALKMFVTTWKDACRGSNADEVLERMLQFYNCRNTNKVKALFTSYPFIGLLNAAVSYINSGMWDNMYDTFQAIDQQSTDSKKSDSSADYISIDVKPPKDGIQNSAVKHKYKHDVTAEDIAKKISGYFEDDILNVKNPSQENIFSFLRKLCKCQYSLIEGYGINEFESLGYGEYFLFIEKYMHLLPHELQKCLMGGIYENATLEARLLPLQLDVLLSQAFGSLRENETVNMQTISELLAQQFPLVCFKLLKCEFTENFVEVLREKRCTMTSNSVLFSTPLLRLNCLDDSLAQDTKKIEGHSVSDNDFGPREGMIGAVTTKDAVEVLLKAPVLTDLKFWSHWDLLFAPSLGSLVEWLFNEVSHKELLCLVTNDGNIIRVDQLTTLDSFLNVMVQGSAFETAVELLSLYALYGGERNVPLSLMKCHARQAFDVMISNSLDKESHDDNNPFLNGKPSCDQQMVTKNTSCDSDSSLLDNRIILDETVAIMSRFILDCLSYLPIEFCSFAADVLIAGLQSFVKGVPLAILAECKEIKHRLILHEVGFTLGLVEWVNDYHSFHSSLAREIFPRSSCLAVASLSNTKSTVQDLSNKNPPCAGEMSVSHEAGWHNVNSNRASSGADSVEVLDDGAAAASEQFSVLEVDEDPVRVIKSIREEEFGLDQSLSAADDKMLGKQHARLGRALHCLSQELYSQDSHFLLELVQNADDNIYLGNVEPTLAFIFQKKGIVVLNNEKGFLANNIRALCDVGNSTKKGHNAGYIGKKGIGFKSVFRVTDAPEIHSNGFHIKFDITEGQIGFVLPTVIPPCDIEFYSRLAYAAADGMDQKSWNTCILLPFRPNSSEAFAINNIVSMFSDLHPSLLLFLHRLKCIMFRNLLDDSVIVMRKEVLGDGIIQVAFGSEKMNWFVVSQKLQVVLTQQLQTDVNRSDVQKTEISLAFTLQETDDGGYVPIVKQQPVFAFLPLRTYGLKFILQGDFVLPSSREEVDGNSPWNQWLRSQFPDLFVSAERAFCDLPCYRGNLGKAVTTFMSFIPLVGEVHGFFSCLPQMIISKLRMSNCLILERDEKEWVPPCKVLRNWTPEAHSLLPDSFLHEHLGLGFLNKDIVLSDTLARALGVEDYGPKVLLRIISLLSHSENGLKSMGLNWLSTFLSAIYVMSSHYSVKTSPSFLSESDIILKLQKTPFIPLSDGKFGSVDEDTVWLHSEAVGQGINDEHALKAFPELYAKLRIVSPNLLAAAASTESSCADATIVDSVKRMLYKVGVQRLSAHEIVKAHILPAISDDKTEKKLMTEYLSFVMLHLQSSCTSCSFERDGIFVELREKAAILTNYGYKRCNDVPIHFNREYMNPFDVNRLINGIDMKWHEVDATYLKHPITKSLSDGLLKWRTFFQDIGVTDFVQTVQVEKRIADMCFVNIKDIIWSGDKLAVDSVAKNWESEELFCLLSWISSEGDREKSILLMEILDSLWDVYFSDKLTGYCIDSSGECSKPFKSSLISILQDAPWIASSFDNQLHYPKELFHDCLAVNSILGVSAPYTIPKVKSEKLLSDIGLKTQVTLNDALSVLELWKRSDTPIKASISQMSNFYGFLWKAMALSKKEIMDALHSGPFIFVPHNTSSCPYEDAVTGALLSAQDVYWHDNISQIEPVRPECDVALTTSPLRRMLCSFYPNLHDFFVNECGVNESPPLHSYLQILLKLCTTTLPHQAAKTVFEVFLKWASALKSGSLSLENIEYLKESLLKKEYTVLPTRQDKWVSLHSSFGLVCWGDDDKLVKEFKHLEGVDFLYFEESTDEENETLHAKVSIVMQTLGIPALSKIVTREAIYYGPQDCSFILSLVNWVLPYAQRYIYNAHPDKYFELKQSISENLEDLKIVVVDNLFYRNVIKKYELTSKKRHECDCLLQENTLYCIKGSDPHSIFLELSCLLYNGTHELHFANFLHMITTMAESGATEDQTEFFVLNSQKVKKLPAEESCWSLQCVSSLPETDSTPLENYHPEKTEEQNSSVYKRRFGINSNWPPADWKTAPGFDYTIAFGSKKSAPFNSVITDSNIEMANVGINCEFNLEADQREITQGEIFHNTEISEFQYSLSGKLVPSGKNTVISSVDRLTPVGMSSSRTNFDDSDQLSSQQAKLTGRMGEFVAFKYFLGKVGGEMSVNWVNEKNETGLPYDITIENNEEGMEYVEVKATKFTRKNWFLITMREWEFAIEKGESFSIAHVMLEDNNMAKVTVYKNPAKLCQLGNLKLAIVVPKE